MGKAFLSATGKAIKIALVDDGINPGQAQIKNLAGGVRLRALGDKIEIDDCWASDCSNSHGTLCARLISHRVPDAALYSVRVLDVRGHGHPLALIAAIKWCVEHQMNLVNLSLGTTGVNNLGDLYAQCKAAMNAGVIMVAAAHGKGLRSFPSAFSETISVGESPFYKEYQFGHLPGQNPEFVACGNSLSIHTSHTVGPACDHPWHSSGSSGTSMAAARITGNAAALLQLKPGLDFPHFKSELAKRATGLFQASDKPHTRVMQTERLMPDNGKRAISQVAVYPLDPHTEVLLANKDQFPFHIGCVVDPVHSSTAGKDAGFLYDSGDLGIPVVQDLDAISSEVETLIVGDLSALAKAERQEQLRPVLQWAVRNGRNVYSLGPEDVQANRELVEEARQKQLAFDSAGALGKHALNQTHAGRDVEVPVVGIFGTSFNQGKMATQLALRRCLIKENYKVSLIGSNPLCVLLNNSFFMTQDQRSPYCLPNAQQFRVLEQSLYQATERQSQLILVGSQGPVVSFKPYSLKTLALQPLMSDLPKEYTLPALTTLIATKPDAVILAVNPYDPEDYIRRTITTIEALGQTKVIALCMPSRVAFERPYQYAQRSGRRLELEELEILRSKYASAFQLPVFCQNHPEEQHRLAQLVINSFAETDE